MPNHIKYSHDISLEKYVRRHGEFRNQNEKKNERKVTQVKCEICENTYSSVGMATHLKHSHSMAVEDYVEEYSEFRKKELREEKSENKKECEVCGEILHSERKLTFHLKKHHDLTKKEYAIQYVHEGSRPTCKCGCGQKTTFVHQPPYFREFISGHNAKGELNPNFGHQFGEETRALMRKRAKSRIEKNEGTLPFRRREAILKGNYGTWENYVEFLDKKKDIDCQSGREDVGDDDKKLKFKCQNCGNKWASSSLGTDCGECKEEKSEEEFEVYSFISKLVDDEVQRNSRRILPGGRELDIVIPSRQIAIEYNGLYWHSEWKSGKHKNYHLDKKREANKAGYRLIQIFSDEWKNKTQVVKNKLQHILGVSNQKRVYARKCKVKEIEVGDARRFINKTHIQGYSPSKHKFGLFYGGNLIGVMTFSRPRSGIGNNESSYELNRYSTSQIVVGGMGKLFKYFTRSFEPYQIKTYADRRWSKDKGNAYEKIGMSLENISEPNYWYTLNYQERKHRFNFTKNRLVEEYDANPEKTEREIMKEMGYDRIWDCGHLKYMWKRS